MQDGHKHRGYSRHTKSENKKRTGVIILISAIIIILLISTCFYFAYHDHYSWDSSYYVEIKSSLSGNYTCIVPIAMKNEDAVSPIMYKLEKIDGASSFELIDTIYGKGLKIEGTGNIKIGIKLGEHKTFFQSNDADRYQITNFSMWKNTTFHRDFITYGNCWVSSYSNNWNGELSIDIDAHSWDYTHYGGPGGTGGGISNSIKGSGKYNSNGWRNATFEIDFFPQA